ncbi:MAG: hypothetical protein JW990_08455 [Thermoleophilia bacterium]|nr:hypothetical protein [Thermoleophilia bacterium]
MKKSLLVTVGLVIVLLVGGCSSDEGAGTSSTSIQPGTGSATSTSTTLGEGSATSSSGSGAAASSTTAVTAKANRYEQDDSRLVYSGTWKTPLHHSASNGSFTYTNSAGGKVTITFEGTHLALIVKKSPKYGKANVTLDGKNLGTIDLYDAETKYQQKAWGTGQLKPGTHTVVIAWTGAKREAATETNINIDCVLVTGTLR